MREYDFEMKPIEMCKFSKAIVHENGIGKIYCTKWFCKCSLMGQPIDACKVK